MQQYEFPEAFSRDVDIDAIFAKMKAQYAKLALERFDQAVAGILVDYPVIESLLIEVESGMDYDDDANPYLEYSLGITVTTYNVEDWVDPLMLEKALAPFHVEEINQLIHEKTYSR